MPVNASDPPPAHGATTFIDDMNEVAVQASRDVYGFYQYLTEIGGGTAEEDRPGSGPMILLGALGVGAQFHSNIIAAANLGNSIANTVLSNQSTSGELEISVTNKSSSTLTLYNYTATGGPDVSNVPDPLFTGQSDVITLTDDEEIALNAAIDLDFSIGNGAALDSGGSSLINFNITYKYTKDDAENERWGLTAAVDGGTPHPYPDALQMFGFTFEPTDPSAYPGFSLYTGPIETASGSISIVVYDR